MTSPHLFPIGLTEKQPPLLTHKKAPDLHEKQHDALYLQVYPIFSHS
jgi:hypothetical protein